MWQILPHPSIPPFLINRTLNLSFALIRGAEPLSSGSKDSSPSSRGYIMSGSKPTWWPTVIFQILLLEVAMSPCSGQWDTKRGLFRGFLEMFCFLIKVESFLPFSLPHFLSWTWLYKEKMLGAAAARLQPWGNQPRPKGTWWGWQREVGSHQWAPAPTGTAYCRNLVVRDN